MAGGRVVDPGQNLSDVISTQRWSLCQHYPYREFVVERYLCARRPRKVNAGGVLPAGVVPRISRKRSRKTVEKRLARGHSLAQPNKELVQRRLRCIGELNGWIPVHHVQVIHRQHCTPQASPVSAVVERQLEDGGVRGPVKAAAEAGEKGRCGVITQQRSAKGGGMGGAREPV